MENEINFLVLKKDEHFKLKKGVCAALTPGKKIGQIKEINKGGLIFQYIDSEQLFHHPVRIDIFSSTYDFYLRNVPVKTSHYYKKGKTVPHNSLSIKQLKIQIGKMTYTQIVLLDYFLKEYILLDS